MAKVLTQKSSGRNRARIAGAGHYEWEEAGEGEGGGAPNYKVLPDDNYQVLVTDEILEVQSPGSGNKTIRLPTFASVPLGQAFHFWGRGSFSQGGDTVTIAPHTSDGDQTIGGRAETSFGNNYQKIEVIRGQTAWLAVVSQQIPVAG